VDDLGGFPEAIKLTKAALHVPESGDIDIRVFPRPKSLYDQFFGESTDNSESEGQAEAAAAMVRALRPVFLEMQRLGVLPQQRQPLSMPVVPAEP